MLYSADIRTRQAVENAKVERGEAVRGAFSRIFRKPARGDRRG